jgi:Domain of unknown function (DUF4118)
MLALRARTMTLAWPLHLLATGALLGLACLLCLLLGPQIGESYPVFVPAVALSGFLFGLPAGLLATAGAWTVGTFFFTESILSFAIDDPFDFTSAVLFPLLATLLLVLIELWVSILADERDTPPKGQCRPPQRPR